MSRSGALARLAAAYAAHQLRRLRRRRRAAAGRDLVLDAYRPDRLIPLTAAERALVPEASACIVCGLCAVVAGRVGGLRPADLASAYLRDYPMLESVRGEVGSTPPVREEELGVLTAAAAACPVGVPLEGVAAMLRRLASA